MRIPRNEPLGSDRSGRRGGGSDAPANAPARRCVLTGRNAGRDELLRLAISPDGLVLPDPNAKAPGRGAWLGVTRAELEEALAKGRLKAALARSFKDGKLAVPDDLPAMIQAALVKSLTDRLGLEMRAGKVLLGSDRIANEARQGKVAALYHAADASADGARKLDQAFRVGLDEEGSGIVGDRLPLDRDALSVALGRDNVVHLALADTASARRVQAPLGRLQAWLGTGIAAGNDGADEAEDTPLGTTHVN